jgi:hypothetical protein
VTKELESIQFDPKKCRSELRALKKLLDSNSHLDERKTIQPFFQKRKQLSAYIGTYTPAIGPAQLIAFEFPILGDFKADVILGNKASGTFCVVEFEDGKPDNIFKRSAKRSMTHWSPRFEHGFSQLVDWFCLLDDFKKTDRFAKEFGHGYIRLSTLLILGRNSGLSEYDRHRLKWRADKVRIDSHSVECLTFDDLYNDLKTRLDVFPVASEFEKKRRK